MDDTYDGYSNANESAATELPDSRLYFNSRDQLGASNGNRLDSVSSDGAQFVFAFAFAFAFAFVFDSRSDAKSTGSWAA